MATIRACLTALGVTSADVLKDCADVAEEFGVVKRLYFKLALRSHPDKGGDPAAFRDIQEAWEALRQLWDSGKVPAAGFAHYLAGAGASAKAAPPSGRTGQPTPSYEWFADAAAEAVPSYRVELAKSGRSQARATPLPPLRSAAVGHRLRAPCTARVVLPLLTRQRPPAVQGQGRGVQARLRAVHHPRRGPLWFDGP